MALGSQSVAYRLPTKWRWGGFEMALGGLSDVFLVAGQSGPDGAPGSDLAQFKRSPPAGSETGVPAARVKAPPPESTDCLSPTVFRPQSVRFLTPHSLRVS